MRYSTPMTVRNTKTKKLVAKIFEEKQTPLLINEVFDIVKASFPQTAYSTVFRIVQGFEIEGKLIAVDWRERGSRYEWANQKHHHHLLCNTCGKVTDIDDRILNFKANTITKETGFRIQNHSIEIFGECSPCQRKQ